MKNLIKDKRLLIIPLSILLILIDQIIKIIVTSNANEFKSVILIPNVLRLTFVNNNGAAFGIFSDSGLLLITLNILIIAIITIYIITKKDLSLKYITALTMILSGGISNLLDRILRKSIVDYIDLRFFPFKNFAIFNFADCLIVFGCALFVVFLVTNEFKNFKSCDNINGK